MCLLSSVKICVKILLGFSSNNTTTNVKRVWHFLHSPSILCADKKPPPPPLGSVVCVSLSLSRYKSREILLIKWSTKRCPRTSSRAVANSECVLRDKTFPHCCSYANCQDTAEEFTKLYRHHPKALESCIIALDARENVVCGCIRLSIDEIPRSNADNFLHVPEKDECYVSTVCVSERRAGKGVGTRLLEEAETFARKYQKTRLTLEVLNGNPAERLYRRFGFEPVEETGAAWCVASCLSCVFIGKREHGKFGRVKMEKTLTYDNTTL